MQLQSGAAGVSRGALQHSTAGCLEKGDPCILKAAQGLTPVRGASLRCRGRCAMLGLPEMWGSTAEQLAGVERSAENIHCKLPSADRSSNSGASGAAASGSTA